MSLFCMIAGGDVILQSGKSTLAKILGPIIGNAQTVRIDR